MRTKGSLSVAVLFLLTGVYGLIQSLSFGYWESVALPAAVSSVIIIMATIEVYKVLRRQGEQETTEEINHRRKIETITKKEMGRLGLIMGWTAALMVGTYLFGFRIAIPLFAFSYLIWRRRHWATATVFALIMLAFVYGAFEIGLKAPLFQGVIFGEDWY